MRFTLTGPGLFQASGADGETDSLTVRALLFYEGDHVDSIGRPMQFAADRVRAIAAATQTYLSQGKVARFFKNHEYSQDNKIGSIVGNITVEPIAETPHPGMSDLIGKLGIYGDVLIAGAANVQAYKDGLIKEISSGIDLPGKWGVKNAIFELSAVGMSALAGAALFGMSLQETMSELAREKAQGNLMGALDDAWWAFRRTIDSIGEEGGGESGQLMLRAAEDFSALLLAQFAIGNPPPEELPIDNPLLPIGQLPTIPLFNAPEATMTEQEILDLQAKNAALETQLASLTRSSQVSARFSALKDKAIALKSAGKLTPAKFKEMGFDEAETTIAKFAAGDDRELDKLEIRLDTIEEVATPVQFGSYLGAEPLPGRADTEPDTSVEMANFKAMPIPWR
jgi:hypothetical protein